MRCVGECRFQTCLCHPHRKTQPQHDTKRHFNFFTVASPISPTDHIQNSDDCCSVGIDLMHIQLHNYSHHLSVVKDMLLSSHESFPLGSFYTLTTREPICARSRMSPKVCLRRSSPSSKTVSSASLPPTTT